MSITNFKNMDIVPHSPGKRLVRAKNLLIAVGILCGLIGGGATLLFPLKYRADAQVYILSQARFGVDPYTVAKSGERIAENLAQVMRTDDFYEKTKAETAYSVDWTYFENKEPRKKKKLWERTISPSVVYGTSVLTVSAYHKDPAQATAIAGAAASAVVTKSFEYVGGDVSIRLVGRPIATQFPVKPNPLTNALAGALIGILFTAVAVVRK